jgi:DNA repair exonuclease SbcCD nuclease subunit
MKILHISDWHLSRTLYGRKRYEEFTAFLDADSGAIRSPIPLQTGPLGKA